MITTTPTVGVTVKFAGLYAEPWVWRALGAVECYPYSNTEDGHCRFGGGCAGDSAAARAGTLIAVAKEKRPGATDEQVIIEALRMYRAEEVALALPRAVDNLAKALRGGHVTHEHRHAVAVAFGVARLEG